MQTDYDRIKYKYNSIKALLNKNSINYTTPRKSFGF